MTQYNLQTLLELRERERDGAQDNVAKAMHRVAQLDQKIEHESQRLIDMGKARQARCDDFDQRLAKGGLEIVEMQYFDDFVRGLKQDELEKQDEIKNLRQQRNTAQREVENLQEALTEAVKQLKAVEKHRESWEAEQNKLKQQKQSAAMDEIAARRWRESNSQ